MAHELAVAQSASIEAADKLLSENQALALDTKKIVTQAILQADLIVQLEQALDGPVMDRIMRLKDSSLGFKTDEDSRRRKGSPPYDLSLVKRCAIEAALKGAAFIGNEFNIIAGNVYLTKGYFVRKLRDMPGLSNLKIDYGYPKFAQGGGGALVDVKASWSLNGKSDSLDCTGGQAIAVRLNEGQGADAALGKAERKIRARIYSQITGTTHDDGEVTDESLKQVNGEVVHSPPPIAPPASTATRTEALKAKLKQEESGHTEAGVAVPTQAVVPVPPSREEATPYVPEIPAPAPAPQAEPPAVPQSAAPATTESRKSSRKTAAAATEPVPSSPSPLEEPKEDKPVETTTKAIANVRQRISGDKRTFRFVIIDEMATEYTTTDRGMAEQCKAFKEKGQRVSLDFVQYTNDLYWLKGVAPVQDEVEAQAQDKELQPAEQPVPQ